MKKTLLLLAVLFLTTGLSWAVRAPRTPFQYTQPDGSILTLVNHGDEFHHWTTCNGTLVEMDVKGFYRPASRLVFESQAAAAQEMRRQASQNRRTALASGLGTGEKHFLVILVEFNDLFFTVPDTQAAFERMLNQPGYNENGGTGSARDYYIDNSTGKFRPIFDVYGPVKLSNSYSYYGAGPTDSHVTEGFCEACALLDGALDFSQYDLDQDGIVDNIFFFYAGYNESEGGGSNTIWPHKFEIFLDQAVFDGVKVSPYACTSELRGNQGASMAGIGTFVHEFAHVIGLPDFYDTDNGNVWNPEEFSVMSDGHSLNKGRTPCYFNSLELQMLGWMGEFPCLGSEGGYELESLSGHHLPWVLPADVEGEQFILEMRDGTGWDAYLPRGMVIYHMDASDNICSKSITARSVWTGTLNAPINVYDGHPCFYAVPSLEYGRHQSESMIFPGSGNVTEFTPVPWSGQALTTRITDISVDGDRVHFNLTAPVRRMMRGIVTDMEGKPIENARVTMSLPTRSSSPARGVLFSRQAADQILYSTTTLPDGTYEIILAEDDPTSAFQVSASKAGYIEQTRELALIFSGNCPFRLRPVGSPSRAGLMKYDPDNPSSPASMGWADASYENSIIAAIHFSDKEMARYAGMEVRSITFCVNGDNYKTIHALAIEEGGKYWSAKAEGNGAQGWFTVDFPDNTVKIVGNKGMYFGFAVDGDDPTPVVYQPLKGVKDGLFFAHYQFDAFNNWSTYPDCALMLSVTLYDPAATQYISLANMGFTTIETPRWKDGYAAGDTFTFRLQEARGARIQSVEWLFDGQKTTAPSVTLTSGKHEVVARIRHSDGAEEELAVELIVR